MWREVRVTRVLIAGDTCPIGSNEPFFCKGDAAGLLGDLAAEFEKADLVVANLECPLADAESPLPKVGPCLRAPVAAVNGLKAMGIDVAGLANNHMMDHGAQGLYSTIEALEAQNIAYVGVGKNLLEARRILVRRVGSVRLGILAMAEHEFSIASSEAPGANPMDVFDAVKNIRGHRSACDCFVVLIHGGNENYPYPGPTLLKTCRFLAEEGASAVICQHSHCAGSMEIHHRVPIVYGQGNFLFQLASPLENWYEGCLVRLTINDTGPCEIEMLPFKQHVDHPGLRRMNPEEESAWRRAFNDRSGRLADPQAVEAEWEKYCQRQTLHYLHMLHGQKTLARRLAGKLGLIRLLDRPDKQLTRLSIIRCQSHRDALITILEHEAKAAKSQPFDEV